jgi:hypothetical protein
VEGGGYWDGSFESISRVSGLVVVYSGYLGVGILHGIVIVLGNVGRADIVVFRGKPELQGWVSCCSSGSK